MRGHNVAETAETKCSSVPRHLEKANCTTSKVESHGGHDDERNDKCCNTLKRRRTVLVTATFIVVAVIACGLIAVPSVFYLTPAEAQSNVVSCMIDKNPSIFLHALTYQ